MHIDPTSPRRIPAPSIPPSFIEKLTRIGGLNRFGEPNLRVVWGCDATKHACGNPHATKYVAARTIKTRTLHALKDTETGEITPIASRDEAIKCDDPKKIYVSKSIKDVEFLGPHCWVVEQWVPPEKIDSKESWERHRYEYFDEQGDEWRNREFTDNVRLWREDVLGPYPERGRYTEVMLVERVHPETGEYEYRPLGDDVIDDIQRRLQAREQFKAKSIEQAIADGHYDHEKELEIERASFEDDVEHIFRENAWALVEGNSRISMAQPSKETGKIITTI